jgi:transposase
MGERLGCKRMGIIKDLPLIRKNDMNTYENMDQRPFESLLESEEIGRHYLVRACWKNSVRFCIRCRTRRLYRIRRDRYRCSDCGYEFSDFAGRWINRVKLQAKDWLQLIKLFELETPARRASQQIGISYPTVLKTFCCIRQSIVAHGQDGDHLLKEEIETDGRFGDRQDKARSHKESHGRIPVFGIIEQDGRVRAEVLRDIRAENILNLTIEKVHWGSIVYTNKFRGYNGLLFCGYKDLRVDDNLGFTKGDVYINGCHDFWNFTKERMSKFHGVSKEKFPLYLKEMEFRYNHRHEPIFDTLIQYLCDLTVT